ncbi:hypothetical protein WMY93_033142 [Mugilogobius chulae]|uniref:Uncharacterized protein n=1 Tax=Mugilogobius chulae TaxID=88201 RepID=A0AAW0MU48_9GOBI
MEDIQSQINTFVDDWINEENDHETAETAWRERRQLFRSRQAWFFSDMDEVEVPWRENEEMLAERESQVREQVVDLLTSAETEHDFAELQRRCDERRSHLAIRKTIRLQQEAWYKGREDILNKLTGQNGWRFKMDDLQRVQLQKDHKDKLLARMLKKRDLSYYLLDLEQSVEHRILKEILRTTSDETAEKQKQGEYEANEGKPEKKKKIVTCFSFCSSNSRFWNE